MPEPRSLEKQFVNRAASSVGPLDTLGRRNDHAAATLLHEECRDHRPTTRSIGPLGDGITEIFDPGPLTATVLGAKNGNDQIWRKQSPAIGFQCRSGLIAGTWRRRLQQIAFRITLSRAGQPKHRCHSRSSVPSRLHCWPCRESSLSMRSPTALSRPVTGIAAQSRSRSGQSGSVCLGRRQHRESH